MQTPVKMLLIVLDFIYFIAVTQVSLPESAATCSAHICRIKLSSGPRRSWMGEAWQTKPEDEFLTGVLFFPCSPGQPAAVVTGCHCRGCIPGPGGHRFRGQQVLV